ncbi:MAG: carbohydrate binding domain-containing protein [Sphingobacteriaceae bacterium]|nr:carbohydrate binding domain-containing protein [Sphingobacteriaceae bacterium]
MLQSLYLKAIQKSLLYALCLLSLEVFAQTDSTIRLTINTKKIVGHVDKKIYGQLLEHIYHSINGGLWGELVTSRSFEPEGAKGGWYLEGDEIYNSGRVNRIWFNDSANTDYEVSVDVKWIPYFVGVPAPWSSGQSDMRILFRGKKGTGQDQVAEAYSLHINPALKPSVAIERNVIGSDGRYKWQTLTSAEQVPAKILSNAVWHNVKIRCEGSVLKVFMDGNALITYSSPEQVQAEGLTGLEVTKTTARFKNMSIRSLRGDRIWSGIPGALVPPPVGPNWQSYGAGKFKLSTEKPLNRNYSQYISASGKSETGIRQSPFDLKAGETYRGSVWARGDGKARVSVSLADAGKELARVSLGVPGSTWKEYKFGLKTPASATKGSLLIAVSGGAVYIDQASLMADSASRIGGFRPDLYQAVAELAPTNLRWPGGSFAAGYDWKWGIGPQSKRIRTPKSGWDDFEQNAFGTDEFLALCKRIGTEPIIVIPIGYDKPDSDRPQLIQSAVDWLEYCNGPASSKWGKVRAANGHPEPYNVKYWEIDNEMWELGVDKYGELLRQFVPALKKKDHSIKIIACGDFTEKGKNRDSVLFQTSAKYFDYISLHHYEGANGFATGPLRQAKKHADEERLIAASANPNIKLFISEWNGSGLDWRTGLYAGGMLNEFEKDPHVEMASAALFLRRTDASSWNNAFVNFDVNGWFAAPNYVITKLYRENYAPNRLELTGEQGGLNCIATQSADGLVTTVKAVNPGEKTVQVSVTLSNALAYLKPQLQLVAPGSLQAANTMQQPTAVNPVDASVTQNGNVFTFIMPPLSVGVFKVKSEGK